MAVMGIRVAKGTGVMGAIGNGRLLGCDRFCSVVLVQRLFLRHRFFGMMILTYQGEVMA